MPDKQGAPNTEEDAQRRVRQFVSDLVVGTIGRTVQLDEWFASAIHEKMSIDVCSYYPKYGTHDPEFVETVSGNHKGEHDGLLYFHRHETVVLLKVISKRVISLIMAQPTMQPDRQIAQKIADELNSGPNTPCTGSAVLYIPFDSNNDSDIWTEAYHPNAEQEQRLKQFVHATSLATITRSSARDIQKMPGPSDLADPCDLCLARRIASSCGIDMQQTKSHFSLKAWVGTCAHQKLERDLPTVYPYAEQEITVPIATIPNFGIITGHVDAYLPRRLTMGDWKTTDMKKLDRIRSYGVSPAHFGQTMLYMYGLKKKKRPCDYATLTYIPRDSNNVSDIWVASCAYREDVAVGLLNRTKSLLDKLRSGDVGSLASDPKCFVCNVQPRIRR